MRREQRRRRMKLWLIKHSLAAFSLLHHAVFWSKPMSLRSPVGRDVRCFSRTLRRAGQVGLFCGEVCFFFPLSLSSLSRKTLQCKPSLWSHTLIWTNFSSLTQAISVCVLWNVVCAMVRLDRTGSVFRVRVKGLSCLFSVLRNLTQQCDARRPRLKLTISSLVTHQRLFPQSYLKLMICSSSAVTRFYL